MNLMTFIIMSLLSLTALASADFPDQEKILNVLRGNSHFTITGSAVWQEPTVQPESFHSVLIVDNESKWNSESVLRTQISKFSNIFKTCGVSANKVLILKVSFTPAGIAVLANERPNPSLGPAEIPIGKAGLPANVMTGFLIKNRLKERDVAYAFNRASIDRAAQTGQDWSSLLYTYWVSDKYVVNPNNPQYSESYSTIAHELTHIMGNLGHTDSAPNLMTNSEKPGAKSGALDTAQCAEIKKNMLR